MPSVLFVCFANVCRSPAAAAILNHEAKRLSATHSLSVDSCAIDDRCLGDPPDPAMARELAKRGIAVEGEAKLFRMTYFQQFDYILAADHRVLQVLRYRARTDEERSKLGLIADFHPRHAGQDIPDPHQMGIGGCFHVCELLLACCSGLMPTLFPKEERQLSYPEPL